MVSEDSDLLLPEFSGFRRRHGTPDCIADLTSALEDFKHRGETAIAVFLDIDRSFYSVSHDVILSGLCHLGFTGDVFFYFL